MARRLAGDDRYDLVALCDRNLGKLRFFQEQTGLEKIPGYASVQACLSQCDVDAVAVTTPDHTHTEVAVPALEANKHVFVEKPLDISLSACQALIEADRRAGGKTFVGHNLRYAPVYAAIRDLIAAGEIGDVLTIQADEFYDGGRTYFRRWNRLRRYGGGLWVTKACHDFDILHWLAGRAPIAVSAAAGLSYYRPRSDATLYCGECRYVDTCPDSFYVIKRRRGITGKLLSEVGAEFGDPRPDLCLFNSDKDTFDHGVAMVEFERGLLATYTCSVVAGFTERRIRVAGPKGTIDGVLGEATVTLRRRDPRATEEVPVRGASGGHGGADSLLFDAFHGFVRGVERPRVQLEEAMVAVVLGLAARQSADEGRRVPVAELSAGRA